jgi:WD40 repeat protein
MIPRSSTAAGQLIVAILLAATRPATAQEPAPQPGSSAELVLQAGHSTESNWISASADGRYVASTDDRQSLLWEVKTRLLLRRYAPQTGNIVGAVMASSGKTLAMIAASTRPSKGHLEIFDVVTGRRKASTELGLGALWVGPVFANREKRIAACVKTTLFLVDAETGGDVARISLPIQVKSVATNEDGSLITLGGYGRALVVDVVARKIIRDWQPHSGTVTVAMAGTTAITIGDSDHNVKLWDAKVQESGTLAEGTLESSSADSPLHLGSPKTRVSVAGDGKTVLVTAGGRVALWSRQTGATTWLSLPIKSAHDSAFVGSTHLISFGGFDRAVAVWDVTTNTLVSLFGSLAVGPRAVVESPGTHQLVVGMEDGRLAWWNMSLGTLWDQTPAHTGMVSWLATCPKRDLIVSASRWDGAVRIWDAKTHHVSSELSFPANSVHGVTMSCSAQATLIWVASGTKVSIWKIAPQTRELLREEELGEAVSRLTASPDGEWVGAVTAREALEGGGTTIVWHVLGKSGQGLSLQRALYRHPPPNGPDGSPDYDSAVNDLAIADGGTVALLGQERLVLVDASSASAKETLLRKGDDPLIRIRIDRSGKRLLGMDLRGNVELWSLVTRTQLGKFSGHAATVWSADFLERNGWFVSVGLDGATMLWRSDSARPRATLAVMLNGQWTVTSPDGLFDGPSGGLSRCYWRVPDTIDLAPLDAAYNDFFWPGLLRDVFVDAPARGPQAQADIESTIRVPGLRTMIRQGLATLQTRKGRVVCCLSATPTSYGAFGGLARATSRGDLEVDPSDKSCPYRFVVDEAAAKAAKQNSTSGRGLSATTCRRPPSKREQGTLWVLAVGIDQYSPGWDSLTQSRSSADRVAKYFSQLNSVFSDVRVRGPDDLEGLEATQQIRNRTPGRMNLATVRNALFGIAQSARPDDVVVIFLSGHGVVLPGDEMFYFVASDTTKESAEITRSTGMSTAMISDALRSISARRIFLIVDSCQSGALVESLVNIARKRVQATGQTDSCDPVTANGVTVLGGALPVQDAVQTNQYSPMAQALMEALTSRRDDPEGAHWVSDVVKYVVRRVPQIASRTIVNGQPISQQPLGDAAGIDFRLGSAREKANESGPPGQPTLSN